MAIKYHFISRVTCFHEGACEWKQDTSEINPISAGFLDTLKCWAGADSAPINKSVYC